MKEPREPGYAGICIGGPRDGQWIECQSNTYQVPFIASFPNRSFGERSAEVRYEYYGWHTFGDCQFWWAAGRGEEPTPRNLIRRLFDGYRKPVIAETTP